MMTSKFPDQERQAADKLKSLSVKVASDKSRDARVRAPQLTEAEQQAGETFQTKDLVGENAADRAIGAPNPAWIYLRNLLKRQARPGPPQGSLGLYETSPGH